ncbi:MAG: gliding motility-associated C-terminal domain-containing protein, partial [Brumimicrobium sp.]|nr:gliding motility-associated C-terminal domain-containing protein [Brumimicrobium sp.]
TVNPNPTFTVAGTDPTTCIGIDGVITITGLTSNTSFDIEYGSYGPSTMVSNSSGSIIINGLASGNYVNVSVTNQFNCTTTQDTIITLSAPATPTVSAIGGIICLNDNITITANGAPAGGTYSWNNGAGNNSTAIVSPATTTIYSISYTLNGCVATSSTAVFVNPLPIVTLDPVADLCEDNGIVNLTTSPSGGIFTGNGISNEDFDPLVAGVGNHIITYTYTDNNNCVNTDNITIVVKEVPTYTLTSSSPTTCGGNDGFITISGLNSNTSYNVGYNGNTPINMTSDATGNIVIANLTANTFTNFIVSLDGCPKSDNSIIVLSDPTPPIVDPINDQIICHNDNTMTVNFTGTPGANYSWTNTITSIGLASSGTGDITTFIGSNTGSTPVTSTITVTPTLVGCIGNTETFTITVNPLPIVNAGSDQIVCETTPVTLSGSGAISYTWDNGVSNGISFVQAVGTITYTVTGTDANNCINTDQVSITVKPLPVFTVTSTSPTTCGGTQGSITLSGLTPATTYNVTYDDDGITMGAISMTADINGNIVITGLDEGTYNNFIVELNGCSTSIATPEQLVDPTPPVVDAVANQIVCHNDFVNLVQFTGTPGATFNWTNTITSIGLAANGTGDIAAFSGINNGSSPVIATVTVTPTLANCYGTPVTFTITVNPLPPVNAGIDQVVCETTPVTLSGSGAVTYTWDNGVIDGTPFIQAVGTLTYTVEGTDVNGCKNTDQVSITVNPLPTATITGTMDVCQNGISPTITIIGATGTAPYIFTYNVNGGANQTITSNGAGIATITAPTNIVGTFNYNLVSVQDNSSTTCLNAQTGTATIIVNPLPTATMSGTVDVCQNDTEPTITFTGATGTAPYTFTYSMNGSVPQTVTSDNTGVATITAPTTTAGTYVFNLISVQDNSSTACSNAQTGTVTIIVNPLPIAQITGTTDVCQNDTEPTVTFTGTGGTAPYTFTYNINGGTPMTITSNNAGVVTITAPTDVAGTFNYNLVSIQDNSSTTCLNPQVGTVTILVNPLPTATITGTVSACINDPEPVVTFTGATGTAPYIFSFTINGGAVQTVSSGVSNTATVPVPTVVDGTYTYELLSVQDASSTNCSNIQTGTVIVTVNPLPVIEAGANHTICEGTSIVLSGSGAGTGGSYTWDQGVVNDIPFSPAPGTYTYTVIGTDANGCSNTDDLQVVVYDMPKSGFTADNLIGCSPFTVNLTGDANAMATSCQWTFSDGTTIDSCGNISKEFTQVGCYDVTLTVTSLEGGCVNTTTQSSYLCVAPDPVASFYMNPDELTILEPTGEFINTSTGGYSYEWNLGDGTTSDEYSPIHEYPSETDGTYNVELIVTSDHGCKDTANMVVFLKEVLLYFIPNTFTPDGNKYNEVFRPVFVAGYNPDIYTFMIFNRWGELIYETNEPNEGWDGIYQGKMSPDGTYVWKIRFGDKYSDKITEIAGHVNLIR